MSIIAFLLTFAVICFVCWLILQIPFLKPFNNIIMGTMSFLLIMFLIIFVLSLFGLDTGVHFVH